jgi:hypothetical protein
MLELHPGGMNDLIHIIEGIGRSCMCWLEKGYLRVNGHSNQSSKIRVK